MKTKIMVVAIVALALLGFVKFCSQIAGAYQEEPPHQPHTNDPAQCTRYCYPKGGGPKPKGTPEGIPGYECKGESCSHVNDKEFEGEVCHEGGGCLSYCAKNCCSCLQTCI